MKGSECQFVRYMGNSNTRFIIPVYQRNYDWKEENCRQLYADLVKIAKTGRKSHFFGSIVSANVPDGRYVSFIVIDGQQRLTTVSLILLAMYNLIDKGILTPKDPNLKQCIWEDFLVNKWQPEEFAFYDALTKPENVKDFYENGQLIALTRELTDTLRRNKTIDWQRRNSARAKMRTIIKRLLKIYKYPPEGMEDAVQTVMQQCELWADNIAPTSYEYSSVEEKVLEAAEEDV